MAGEYTYTIGSESTALSLNQDGVIWVDQIKGLPCIPQPTARNSAAGAFEPVEFSISMWVSGADPISGLNKTNDRWEMMERNVALVMSRLATGLEVQLEQEGRNDTLRRYPRIEQSIVAERSFGNSGDPFTRIVVIFKDYGYFWRGASFSVPVTTTGTNWSTFLNRGATAPILDAKLTIPGQVTAPVITFPGGTFRYSGSVAEGESLVVDAGQWTVKINNTDVPQNSVSAIGANGRWFKAVPGDVFKLSAGAGTLSGTYRYF